MFTSTLTVTYCLLAACVSAAPATDTTNDLISQSTLIHIADHDVTHLGVLFKEEQVKDKIVFFIESDINEQGERVNYGLHALTKDPKNVNNTVATKILDNARDIAVVSLSVAAYFAANDGIYVYNIEKNTAEKYGAVNEEVICIAAENATGALYYVNKQHQLYKMTEGGQKFTIIDVVKNAKQITTDYKGNLYYYTVDKKFYVYNGQNVKKVEGFPENLKKVSLVRTPVLVEDYGIVNGDDQYYVIYGANATVHSVDRGQRAFAASALSVDSGILLYFAEDKKIYEFDIIAKVLEGLSDALSTGLKRVVENMRNSLNSVYA